MSKAQVGLWLIGARGSVAATVILGLAALKRKLIEPLGSVSSLPQFARVGLAEWENFVVSGHEIRRGSLRDEITALVNQSRSPHLAEIADQCRPEIEQIDRRIRWGTIYRVGETIAGLADGEVPQDDSPRRTVQRLKDDMAAFVASEKLEHLVVINVASTEPPADVAGLPRRWSELEKLLDDSQCPLPASTLYAIAALEGGHSYINFTPSLGAAPAAIDELAGLRRTRHYGCDGKTGETLMKSVLGPMFAERNFKVLSWVGHNIFGNRDGRVLADPANKQTKIASKDRLLGEILGYRPHTLVSIEYVPDLGDWKTAWDHVHFSGFLGVPMTLQFIWQGCDSFLAAPLVLDLARFTELAWRRGVVGRMPFLASFFKSPLGLTEHGFERQFQMLVQWAATT